MSLDKDDACVIGFIFVVSGKAKLKYNLGILSADYYVPNSKKHVKLNVDNRKWYTLWVKDGCLSIVVDFTKYILMYHIIWLEITLYENELIF